MSSIFLLLFFLSFTSSVLSTKDDEIVLLKLKKQLGDPDFLQSWVQGSIICHSPKNYNAFVGCTSNGRVSILSLQNLNITVPFPDAVCGLTELAVIDIKQMPGLYGPIPSCITELSNLNVLFIRETSLSGLVPSFYNHTNISMIELSDNRLSGTIPASLSTLPNLNYLDLSSNYLIGTIPPGLVHGLSRSPYLRLSNNNLTGELPKCYGFVDFMLIDLRNNRLSGDASFLFGKQRSTYNIGLANNDFEFDFSRVEFSDSLNELDISHNKIYGKVPESIATAAVLYYANLSFNRLCGELPQGGNMCLFNAAFFVNNTCLFGNPWSLCSLAPAYIPAYAPSPAPVSDLLF